MDPLLIAVILYLVAILLFVIDLFVPTGGILLVCSAVCAMIAIYFGFLSSTNTGLVMLLIELGTIPALVYVFLRAWPHTPFGRRVLLQPPRQPASGRSEELHALIGSVVISRWPLIPTGQIQIGHRRYNAMSFDGRIIETKTRVKVVGVYERMLIVGETIDPLTEQNTKLAEVDAVGPIDPRQISAEQIGLNSLEE